MGDVARARTLTAFGIVRRRVRTASIFIVFAHGAAGAVFGLLLAWLGEGSRGTAVALAVVAAAVSAAWAAGRQPAVEAGRLLERRFPGCRNVLVTADELLSGALQASDAATVRVLDRAAAIIATVEPRRAAMLKRRVAMSLAAIAASAAIATVIWRAL